MGIEQNGKKERIIQYGGIKVLEFGNTILLSEAQIEDIKKRKKKLGAGVDGAVYGMDFKTAFKFYHSDSSGIIIPKSEDIKIIYDEDGVNRTSIKEMMKRTNDRYINPIRFIDSDGVILGREDAILRAIEKQKDVKLTYLPQKIIKRITTEGSIRVVGCAYRRYHTRFSIYVASHHPLLRKRKEIMFKLYVKFKELIDNNIYPITLVQKDKINPSGRNGANVLLSLDLEPLFVDLDGISAIYTDSFSEYYYKKALNDFSTLAMEVISGLDYDSDGVQDIEQDIADLVDRQIPYDIARDFYYEDGFSTEEQVLRLLK